MVKEPAQESPQGLGSGDAAYGSMDINGEKVGDGQGSDVMSRLLEPPAWLANKLAEQGSGLSAGMVIITGNIVSLEFLKAGDKASISIEGLGSTELNNLGPYQMIKRSACPLWPASAVP